MGPGDVIFIPEGWPHQVLNKDDTLAVSYNFVDVNSFQFLAYLRNYFVHPVPKDATKEDKDYREHASMQFMWMHTTIFSNQTEAEDPAPDDLSWSHFFQRQQPRGMQNPKSPFSSLDDEEMIAIMGIKSYPAEII